MDLRNLNTFIQVAELSSFTRAAEKLGYSQPTISFQIRQLEEEIGAKLFERIGHTIRLTPNGRNALSYAQQICQMAHDMAHSTEEQDEIYGLIHLAMADSLCEPLVVNGFAQLRKVYPGISLNVTSAGTGGLFRMLDQNEVDLVCTLDNHIYNTNYIIASEEKVGVHFICSVENPLAGRDVVRIDELLTQPFLLTEKKMSYRRMMDERLAQDSIEIRPVLEFGGTDLICRLVCQNMGLSFLPDYVTEADVRAGRIVRLQVEGFEVSLWKQLLYHRDKWVSRQLQAVIDHLSGIRLNNSETN